MLLGLWLICERAKHEPSRIVGMAHVLVVTWSEGGSQPQRYGQFVWLYGTQGEKR